MSAYIVANGHIDILVAAAQQYGTLGDQDPQAAGQMLWDENFASVNFRYSDAQPVEAYELHTTDKALHPVVVLKALGAYEYQSDQREDWETSAPHAFITRIQSVIYAQYPELAKPVPSRHQPGKTEPAYYTHKVYDLAPWGFEDLSDAYANAYPA